MTGGLYDMVSKGYEDLILIDKPQITFFKTVYRRHTPFNCEPLPQKFVNNNIDFGKQVHCTLGKSGDLVGNIYIVVKLPEINIPSTSSLYFAWVKRIGFALIKDVSIVINGTEIDKHYGEWLNLWSELTGELIGPHKDGIKKIIGDVDELTNFSQTKKQYELFIPLKFWFNRCSGSFLPLTNMLLSDIKINVSFANAEDCYLLAPTHSIQMFDNNVSYKQFEYIEQNVGGTIYAGIFISFDITKQLLYFYLLSTQPFISISTSSTESLTRTNLINFYATTTGQQYVITGQTSNYKGNVQLNAKSVVNNSISSIQSISLIDSYLLVDYYFLDNEERKKMIKTKQDYIIDQLMVSTQTISTQAIDVPVKIYNSCKMVVWTTQLVNVNASGDYFNYTNSYKGSSESLVDYTTILCNGVQRISLRDSNYFEFVQKYETSTSTNTGINMYSFAYEPYAPIEQTGSFNLSLVDDIKIKLIMNTVNSNTPIYFKCYGFCINFLRIRDGIAGPLFINNDNTNN